MPQTKECDNLQIQEVNKNLIGSRLTLNDLKTFLRLKFKSYKEAGRIANISECRVRQIIIGYKLPSSSELITKIAGAWGIDPVKLALLFDAERIECPPIITADKLKDEGENGNV